MRGGLRYRAGTACFFESKASVSKFRWLLVFCLPLLLTRESIAQPPFPKPEEWPAYRRDGSLQAHSPARGTIVAPRIVWRQFVGVLESLIVILPSDGGSRIALPLDESKASPGSPSVAVQDFIPQSDCVPDEQPSATVTFADVLPDEPGREKIEFESGFAKPTVNGQWQKCVGRCFARREGKWVQVWETQPIDMIFQPLPLVGDFDADGKPEIAILPMQELLLLDARTGAIKDRCRFTDTRSYGFFGAYDFDRDGRIEFLVQGDFSKHVDVLGFRDGKLSVLWQRKVEEDISNPQKILRVGPNPVADVDGDGLPEVLTTVFNERGDQRWWLTMHDALTGREKAKLPDEYLVAALDLRGAGTCQLLTLRTIGAGVPEFGTIRVRSFTNNRLTTVWERNNAAWATWEPPLPPNVQSTATFGRTTVMNRRGPQGTTVVLRGRTSASTDSVTLATVRWDGGSFKPLVQVTGRKLQAVGLDGMNRLLVRVHHHLAEAAGLRAIRGKAALVSTKRLGGSPGPAVVAWLDRAQEPTIIVQGHGEELVAFQPPLENGSPSRLTRIDGRGQSANWPEARGPVIADLAGDGRRQILLATANLNGCARFQVTDLRGRPMWHHDFASLPGTAPVWNTGGLILWQTGHFTDARRQDVLLTLRRSMMHSEETALLSGKDGRELWRRDRQISQRGVGGTPFAIADYDGDGLDDLASLHPSILYLVKGNTGRDLVAKDATWNEVPAKPVYWGQPIAGDFLGPSRPALFFGGRSMTGLLRADGSLAWWDALDHGPQDWPAFGHFTGRSGIEAIGAGYPDGIRCYDAATGKVLWRLPMPVPGAVLGSASADLDGDGRDEALFVIGQNLVCLDAGAAATGGRVRWQLALPTQTGPPSLAVLGRSEEPTILLVGSDGYVYAVR